MPFLLAFQYAADNTTPPTFNGVALTFSQQVGTSFGGTVFLWLMKNPPDGSLTFVPNGFGSTNVYSINGIDNTTFSDVFVNDQADIVNSGVTLTPTKNNGLLVFFQQASSGSGTQAQTAGQGNVLGMGFGATFTHASPGAGNSYHSTVTYSPSINPYDQFGISIVPPTSFSAVLLASD